MKQISIIDDFFTADQYNKLMKISKSLQYTPRKNEDGIFAHRNTMSSEDSRVSWVIPIVEKKFNKKLKATEINFDIRDQVYSENKDRKMLSHTDDADFNFICYLEGKQTVYNGTGFCCAKTEVGHELNTYIGFQKNRGLFFNGKDVFHGSLQGLGDSDSRLSLSIFFDEVNN